eukprot:Gb_10800 [translate_table: standard]
MRKGAMGVSGCRPKDRSFPNIQKLGPKGYLAGRRNETRMAKDCPRPWSLCRSTHAEHTTDPTRPQEESNANFPTNSRTFQENLESVINEFSKITLTEGEEGPPCYIAEEETSTNTTEESSETFDSSEFSQRTEEPVSMHRNPLFKRGSKMAPNRHQEISRPLQPMGTLNQDGNNQDELQHKQKTNNTNPFVNFGPYAHQQPMNNNQDFQANAQPNLSQNQNSNTSGSTLNMTTFNIDSGGISYQNQGFETCLAGQVPTNTAWGTHTPNLGPNTSMSPNGGNQNPFRGNPAPNFSSQMGAPNLGGQPCSYPNTNFSNTNIMGNANSFNQGQTFPNTGWNNNLGTYGNGTMPNINPTNQFPNTSYNGGNPFSGNGGLNHNWGIANLPNPFNIGGNGGNLGSGTTDTEHGFVKKGDDAASTRDSSESTTSSPLESTYHCGRASNPHEPTLEDEININSNVDSEEFTTNCSHNAYELNQHSCFHFKRLPEIDEEEEMGYYKEDLDAEDADDEEEIVPEVIQQDSDENTFQPDET